MGKKKNYNQVHKNRPKKKSISEKDDILKIVNSVINSAMEASQRFMELGKRLERVGGTFTGTITHLNHKCEVMQIAPPLNFEHGMDFGSKDGDTSVTYFVTSSGKRIYTNSINPYHNEPIKKGDVFNVGEIGVEVIERDGKMEVVSQFMGNDVHGNTEEWLDKMSKDKRYVTTPGQQYTTIKPKENE